MKDVQSDHSTRPARPDAGSATIGRQRRHASAPVMSPPVGGAAGGHRLSVPGVTGLQNSVGNAVVAGLVAASRATQVRPVPLTRGTVTVQRNGGTSAAPRPRYAEGQGTVTADGQYLIWGTWRDGDDIDGYMRRTFERWVTWRHGNALSSAARGQIVHRLAGLPFRVLQRAPEAGQQYFVTIDRAALAQLTGIAERDPEAQAAERREEEAGLPTAAPIAQAPENAGEGAAPPPAHAAPAMEPGGTAVEAPSGSEFEGGAGTANRAALPASLSGPDIAPTGSIGAYTMRLDYSIAGPDQLSQVVEAMNSVHYHFELFRITELVQGGMEEQIEQHRRRAVSQNDRVGRLDAAGRRAEQAGAQLVDETVAAATEVANPVDAAHGGTAAEVLTRAQANLSSISMLPVSTITALGGVALGALADFFGGDRHEQEVPWPRTAGYYLIRCIAQPRSRGEQRRAASVAIKLVQVRSVASLARAAVVLPHAVVAEKELELELARRQGGRPEQIATLDRQLADARTTASGTATDVIALRIREKEAELEATPAWRRRDIERQLEALREQQEHARNRARGLQGTIWRPEGAIVSRLDGQTYPLLLQLGLTGSGQGHVWRLSDVSTADGRHWLGRGSTATEAVRNAAQLMARGNAYGPGSLAIRFPAAGPFEAGELVLDNVNTGTALARRRLADLATALAVLGLFVPGVGQVAAVVGAAVAADRLIDRWQNGSLRMDADAVSDLIGVLGAAAQAVSAVGRVRVVRLGDRFVLASSTADEHALLAAVRRTHTVREMADVAGDIANWGGFAFGGAVTLNTFVEVNAAELRGELSHAEARRRRAQILTGALREATLQLTPPPRATPRTGSTPDVPPPAHRSEGGEADQHGRAPDHPGRTPDTSRGSGPAVSDRSVEPGRLAALEAELGNLAGQVALVENPQIGSSVLVRYADGRLRIEVGPDGGARHVRAHVETARALRRYEGAVGVMRQLLDRIRSLLRLSPGYGTEGFEARLEVRKLTQIKLELERMLRDIDVRAARMSADENLARSEAAVLQRELTAIEAQLAQHSALVDSYQPGRGFVAALDEATARHFGGQHRELQTIIRGLNRAGRPDLVTVVTDVARHEATGGNIRGVADWIRETGGRLRGSSETQNLGQVVDKAVELAEVWRISQEVRSNPDQLVRFVPGGSGRRSFDIEVQVRRPDADPETIRQIEVWEHDGIPVGSRSLNAGIVHAAGKIPPAAAGPPGGTARTEPTREATVSIEWLPSGSRDLPTGGPPRLRMEANGDYRPLGGTPPIPRGMPRNMAADLLAELRSDAVGPRVNFLDAVNIVGQTGQLLWRFVNVGTAAAPQWERVQ